MKKNKMKIKAQAKSRRAGRVRTKVSGTAAIPRLCIFRSLKNISAQLIDDDRGVTLASASDKKLSGNKIERAAAVGKILATRAGEKKIVAVVFDRAGNKYHGRIKALAEAAREGGLKF